MADDFGKLSQEQLQKLAGVISSAKELTSRQAEIIERVLAGETDIGKLRISYLKSYFDMYSIGLDQVARKYSQLDDAFLILDEKATESFQQQVQYIEDIKEEELDSLEEVHKRTVENLDKETLAKLNAEEEISDKQIKEAKKVSEFIEKYSANFYKNAEEQDNRLLELTGFQKEADELRYEKRASLHKKLAGQEKDYELSLQNLYNLSHQDKIDKADQITSIRLNNLQEVTDAEIKAQSRINSFEAEIAYANKENYIVDGVDSGINEAGAIQAQQAAAKDLAKFVQKQDEARTNYIAKRELEAKRKNNGILSKEEATRIQREAAKKFKLDREHLTKLAAEEEKREAGKALKDEIKNNLKNAQSAESWEERKQTLKDLTHDEDGGWNVGKTISAAIYAVSDMAKQLEKKIDDIASYKSAIDTRLQGSSNEKYAGSYWDQLTRDMTAVGAINPYYKQETFANNMKDLVNRGISFDLKQRAFLMTIQDKIATTFDVADGTLLRLIRIQQEDSTAGRLGMESALNTFLNNMYENTEYLSQVADSVRGSLEEMQSLMSGAEATEVEYQVQKWLGSLYSVGMSQNAVSGISDALGKIAAGQIEGLTNGGAGNLLIMAANDAGLSIADILTKGIDATDTNKLLQASVNYLAELAESAKDNKVVQQQLADVFGVRASDLRAATNLVLPGSVNSIYGNSMTYENMLGQLMSMAGTMGSRTSMAEMMTNFWENGQYTLAGSMASNPVSYFIYKMAKVVDDAAGGIDLPFLNVMGFGVDLNTTVSDLMRVAAVGSGILGSLGPLVSGLGNSFSGRAMLNQLGISSGAGLTVTPRGTGSDLMGSTGGGTATTSGSGYIGNASGSDVKDSTIQESEDSKKKQMIEAKEEAEANQVDVLNTTVIKIYELLDDVAHGNGSFTVKVEGYGLTKSSSGGAIAGVDGLNSGGGASSTGGAGSVLGSINSSNVSGSVDLGGWTMT